MLTCFVMGKHKPKLVRLEPATIKSRIPDFENLSTDELIDRICEDEDLWFVQFINHNPSGHTVDPDFED